MKRYLRNSLFYKYFISYVIVLAIPVMSFGALLYYKINKNYREEIENYRIINSNRLVSIFDNEYKILNSMGLRVGFDRTMSRAVVKQNEYHAMVMIDTLKKYAQESGISADIYVYFNNDDIVYSPKGTMKLETMFDSRLSFTSEEEKEFLSLLNCESGHYIGAVGNSDVIASVFTVPYHSTKPYGTVTVVIDKKSIGKLLGIGEENEFSFCVFNEREELVACYGAVPGDEILKKAVAHDNYTHSNGDNYFINTKSNQTDLKYVTIYPQMGINAIIREDVNTLLIFSLVSFICINIAAIMASRNYKPIRNIIDRFLDNAQRKAGRNVNELDYINRLIGDTIEKNRKLLSKIDEQLPFIKEQILLMLIKGETVNNDVARELLFSSGIEFDYEYFAVVSLAIPNYSKNEILAARVSNIIKLSLSEEDVNLRGHMIELLRGDRVIILNGDKLHFEKEFLYEKFYNIQNLIREQLKMKTNIGIGSIVESLDNITISFEEAQYALNYMFVNGYGYLLFYNDLIGDKNNVLWFPTEEMVSFSNHLKQGNYSRSLDLIGGIFSKVKKQRTTPGISKTIGFGIISAIINIINDYNISGLNKDIEALSSYESLEELEMELAKVIRSICDYFNDFRSNRNMQLKVELIKYINENFTNPGLSLEMLAEEFNYTDKYISRFLFQNTGYRFSDYIKRLRIDYAKNLLKQTENTIKEIVEMSGYADPSSFTRTFSSLEGITPGRYRELNR